ncbi:MAG: ATP-binding protein [Negativicutes bacterium]|nr:ATP-binding protein [Negativicutes bacterium]
MADRSKHMKIASSVQEIEKAVTEFRKFLVDKCRCTNVRTAFNVEAALRELMLNADEHAHSHDSGRSITVDLDYDDEEIAISVQDEGKGFDLEAVLKSEETASVDRIRGRGLLMLVRIGYRLTREGNVTRAVLAR